MLICIHILFFMPRHGEMNVVEYLNPIKIPLADPVVKNKSTGFLKCNYYLF